MLGCIRGEVELSLVGGVLVGDSVVVDMLRVDQVGVPDG